MQPFTSQYSSTFQTPQASNRRKVKMKITVVGQPMSGKSSFIRNLVYRQFNPVYTSTQSYQITLYEFGNNDTEYQIQLWQCGCNHLKNNKFLRKAFFRNSSATFLLFDLCNPAWKQHVVAWMEEAYSFESFLVYAVGTKKDLFELKISKQRRDLIDNKQSLFTQSNMQGEYEYQNNIFFDEYQIRHYYQSATQKVPYQIKNVFIAINDDRQKLTRSSLARGTKFDNSILQKYSKEKSKQDTTSKKESRISSSNVFTQSVVIEQFNGEIGKIVDQQYEQEQEDEDEEDKNKNNRRSRKR